MKGKIKVCTASKEFSEDQIAILKRVSRVLVEHGFSVDVSYERKVVKHMKLKIV